MLKTDEDRNRRIVGEMEQALAVAAENLQPEMEPAPVYRLTPPDVTK